MCMWIYACLHVCIIYACLYIDIVHSSLWRAKALLILTANNNTNF